MGKSSDAESQVQDEIVDSLLTMAEGTHLDFKRVGRVDTAVKTACAMANTGGGHIVLGVEDSAKANGRDRLYGIDEKPECVAEFQRALVSRLTPPLQSPHCAPSMNRLVCTIRDGSPGRLALTHIPKSNEVHSLVDGGTYARYGPQNRQLSAREITDLSLRRGTQSAVDAVCDAPLDLLDTDFWREYSEQRKLTRGLSEALRHLGLARTDESGELAPTVAAVLLFAEHPGGLLERKCAIRILHYKGHQVEYDAEPNLVRRPITIDGPILHQVRATTEAIVAELESGLQVSSEGFGFTQKYPRRVIQEAVTNAVIHRDYRLSEDIQIRLFANRIEVESPGVFPGAVTPDNVKEIGSKPRNRAIVEHLREFPVPPSLDAGEGVKMMFSTLEGDGLYPPVFEEESTPQRERVLVKLSNEARLPEWILVRDHLLGHGTVGNADVRRILNLGDDGVKASRFLRGWVDKGLIEVANPDSGTRSRRYQLPAGPELGLLRAQSLLSNWPALSENARIILTTWTDSYKGRKDAFGG